MIWRPRSDEGPLYGVTKPIENSFYSRLVSLKKWVERLQFLASASERGLVVTNQFSGPTSYSTDSSDSIQNWICHLVSGRLKVYCSHLKHVNSNANCWALCLPRPWMILKGSAKSKPVSAKDLCGISRLWTGAMIWSIGLAIIFLHSMQLELRVLTSLLRPKM